MALNLPPNTQPVGSIEITLTMGADGVGVAYGMEGVSPEAAIGYLTVVSDRIREERRLQWDTCPGCGVPWEEHDEGEDGDPE